MTNPVVPTRAKLTLRSLVYDSRYRSYTIQFLVLALLLLFLAWIANNTVANLAQRGKDIDFSFLWARAGYDIGQHLIPYTNDSSHFRAAVVGLLNTVLVAFLACVFATVLGTLAGILRLSNNWLIARLVTVYIEVFRNVPLLLWIIVASVVLVETRPSPKDFKLTDEMIAAGQAPNASMWLWDSVSVTNRSTNIPAPVLDRPLGEIAVAGVSIDLSLVAVVVCVLASLFLNRAILRWARERQEKTGTRPRTLALSLAVLFLPIASLLIAMGFHLEYPVLKGFNFQGGLSLAHSFTALLVALTLYSATYIAEIVRSGIVAISRGQTEAAYALGLRPGATMRGS